MGPPTSGAFNLECILTPLLGDPVMTQRTRTSLPSEEPIPALPVSLPKSALPVSPAHLQLHALSPPPASASPQSLPPHPPCQRAGPCRAGFDPGDFCGALMLSPLRASCRLSPSPPCPGASPSPPPVSCGCISGCAGLVHPLFQPQCPHAVEFLMPVEHVPKYSHCTDPLVSSTVHPRPPCILTVPVQEGDQPKAGLLTTSSRWGVGLGAAWSRTFLALLSC